MKKLIIACMFIILVCASVCNAQFTESKEVELEKLLRTMNKGLGKEKCKAIEKIGEIRDRDLCKRYTIDTQLVDVIKNNLILDPRIKSAAARALGKLAGSESVNGENAVKLLQQIIQNDKYTIQVRYACVEALVAMFKDSDYEDHRGPARAIATTLEEVLKNTKTEDSIKGLAMQVLVRTGSITAIKELSSGIKSSSSNYRMFIYEAAMHLLYSKHSNKIQGRDIMGSLGLRLSAKTMDVDEVKKALQLIRAINTESKVDVAPVSDKVIEIFKYYGSPEKANAEIILECSGVLLYDKIKQDEAVKILSVVINNNPKDAEVLETALSVFTDYFVVIPSTDKTSLQAMMRAAIENLNHEDMSVREAAAWALGMMPKNPGVNRLLALDALIERLSKEDAKEVFDTCKQSYMLQTNHTTYLMKLDASDQKGTKSEAIDKERNWLQKNTSKFK